MANVFRIRIERADSVLDKFANQLAAVGEGKARVAMARALNRAGRTIETRVIRSLVQQTSAPRSAVVAAIGHKGAAHKGGSAIEFVIYGKGSELPLRLFRPRQFSFGVKAKVWGTWQRYPSMFGAPGDTPGVVAALGGRIFHRTGKSRLPIEQSFGPSIPKEMVKDETAKTFQELARSETEKRLRHELSRMLPG